MSKRERIPRERMVKPIDAWWTVIVIDPVAVRVVPPLTRWKAVTPTRITMFAHLLGIVSALLFLGDHLAAGAIVFEIRFLADCIDGKLARVTGRSSVLGAELDALGDRIFVTANLAALAWTVSHPAAVVLAAVYPVSLTMYEARLRLAERRGGGKLLDEVLATGWGGWAARHRLNPIPTSVDVEHLTLFCLPLLAAVGVDLVEPGVWLAAAFFSVQILRYGASLLRIAADLDRG